MGRNGGDGLENGYNQTGSAVNRQSDDNDYAKAESPPESHFQGYFRVL
jgi:hypothetical protein